MTVYNHRRVYGSLYQHGTIFCKMLPWESPNEKCNHVLTKIHNPLTLSVPQDIPYVIKKRSRLKVWVEIFHI